MRLAICIISYNRSESVRRVLSSIDKGFYLNDSVDLIISIDYSGSDAVEKVASEFKWEHGEKKIISHNHNLGLRQHVLKCGELTRNYDGLIVLEDDVFVAPSFYLFAKACVLKYNRDDKIAGISLYSFAVNYHNMLPFIPLHSDSDIYLMQNAQSWGQVWMPRQWSHFMEWYAVNNDDFPEMPHLPKSICSWKKSWLKYHTRYCIETNKFFVYPYTSLSSCFSDDGEHTSGSSTIIQVPLLSGYQTEFQLNPTVLYDSFFENILLSKYFDIENTDDLCIDIYGEKQNRQKRRFWLTRKICNYAIVRSFGLKLKPFEQNIINNISGHDIFLYDTTLYADNPYKTNQLSFDRYLYNYYPGIRKLAEMLKTLLLQRFSR